MVKSRFEKTLEGALDAILTINQKGIIEFFNKATAINTRMHQIELLPGYGKKHMKEILEARKEKEFDSFEELKKRLPSLPDPKASIRKRIVQELQGTERHKLFVM